MVKPATTYENQMLILKSRGIIINDEQFCIDILSHLNYYRLTAYMLPYKINNDKYEAISFEKIYNIYEFDRKLKSLVLSVLEEIELLLRTKLAYYHSHKFGPLGYLDENNYNKLHRHDDFINEFNKLVKKNCDNLFVRHHMINKSGEFPIWVAVELFPFGMLSRFYADLCVIDKKNIAKREFNIGYQQLESWLLCLSTLRNRCAHYMRLYYYNFNKWPNVAKNEKIALSNQIFDFIYIMRYCYLNIEKWNSTFFLELNALMEQYEKYIELRHIGFPSDWRRLLKMT